LYPAIRFHAAQRWRETEHLLIAKPLGSGARRTLTAMADERKFLVYLLAPSRYDGTRQAIALDFLWRILMIA